MARSKDLGTVISPPLQCDEVRRLVRLALDEDRTGQDVTTLLTVPAKTRGRAVLIAQEELVICGLPLVELISKEYGSPLRITPRYVEGTLVQSGTAIAVLEGPLQTLLSLERTILNFLQRLSGVATKTRALVEAARGMTVLDTRKTTPGYRLLEKYAVRVGGGANHRGNLSDMALVKNNHIDANGGDLAKTMKQLLAEKPPYLPVEVEVRNQAELAAALAFPIQAVMLDNMDDEEIKKSLAFSLARRPDLLVEISGGITAARCARLAKLGVRCISSGSVTRQAQSLDIALRIARG